MINTVYVITRGVCLTTYGVNKHSMVSDLNMSICIHACEMLIDTKERIMLLPSGHVDLHELEIHTGTSSVF